MLATQPCWLSFYAASGSVVWVSTMIKEAGVRLEEDWRLEKADTQDQDSWRDIAITPRRRPRGPFHVVGVIACLRPAID